MESSAGKHSSSAARIVRPVLALVLVLLAVAYVVFLKPVKADLKQYRIGEQGLAEQGNLQREELSRIVVANLNGYDVSAREVERALTELPPFQRFYYSSPEKITVFLRAYALMQLLSVQAVDAGLAKRPYVLMVLEEKLAARYKLVYLANRVKPSDITEEEIKRYLREPVDRRGFPGGLVEKETAAKAAIVDARRQEAWYRHLVELGLSPTHAQPTGLQQ